LSKKRKDIVEINVPVTKPIKSVGKLELRTIIPLTRNQELTFDAYSEGKQLCLHGMAGTGKSFISLYLALKEQKHSSYKNVKIVRSVVPSRDVGFLPGTLEEKQKIFEQPYVHMVNNLYTRSDAYAILVDKGILEFCTTSFLRGETFEKSIIIVDEIQNMSFGELDTVITRVGDDCRTIFCGDYRQSDLPNHDGLDRFLDILETMECFKWIEFLADDIVRNPLVKKYIIAREAMKNG
jgi:phosphate starvation-inducible PhoH-like protein